MFIFLTAGILIAAGVAVGLFYYVFSIPEPEGLSIAKWPQDFTNSFALWVHYENGELAVDEIGLARLDAYGLWIQFIDESGQEIFSHNKPAGYPAKYAASELIAYGTGNYNGEYTVFTGSLDDPEEVCSYIIGFPYNIGKYVLHYNGDRVARLFPVAEGIVLATLGIFTACVLIYGLVLTRNFAKITGGIRNMSRRSYEPLQEKGMFGEIYGALNKMNQEICHADKVAEETERWRKEWIANITHDLKTPLSPIKGYAEMLADSSAADKQTIQEYGAVILRNVDYTEHLINDLKLTYQLDCGTVPYKPEPVLLTRCVREWVIDIVNDPAFANRKITFESNAPTLTVRIDPNLLRRAVKNLIVNALVHNPADTKVDVILETDSDRYVYLYIRDNGSGISETEQEELFNRYYRGTNTKEKPEGSGLGLAIAKQIIVLHGGDITVHSKSGGGTEFAVCLPLDGTAGGAKITKSSSYGSSAVHS